MGWVLRVLIEGTVRIDCFSRLDISVGIHDLKRHSKPLLVSDAVANGELTHQNVIVTFSGVLTCAAVAKQPEGA